jgi:plastocyanin
MDDTVRRVGSLTGLALAGTMSLASAGLFASSADPQAEPSPTGASEPSARVIGRVELLSENGERLRDRSEFANAVIYFEPDERPRFASPDAAVEMTTRRREFVPRVLVVATGTKVRFPNEDPILHNVFSTSGDNRFDLGVYGESPGKTHRFDHPGLVRVFCNVHSRMSAHIVVVDGPHFTRPDRDGRFSLEDLPAGPGRLTVWHERASPERVRVVLEAGMTHNHDTRLELTIREAASPPRRMRRRGRY